MHYEQCYMHEPCEKSRDGAHTAYPEGTNGDRQGYCRECDKQCICNRLVSMRNEGRTSGIEAAQEAVENLLAELEANHDEDRHDGAWDALVAIKSLHIGK